MIKTHHAPRIFTARRYAQCGLNSVRPSLTLVDCVHGFDLDDHSFFTIR